MLQQDHWYAQRRPLNISCLLLHGLLPLLTFRRLASWLRIFCTFAYLLSSFYHFLGPKPLTSRLISFSNAIMKFKSYRFSLTHLIFYVSSSILSFHLWSVWKPSSLHSYLSYSQKHWEFDADLHSNVHTLSNEQCNIAFPKLYNSLDQAVHRRSGRKVHIKDIEINEGRCMLRVMIHQGEVCISKSCLHS